MRFFVVKVRRRGFQRKPLIIVVSTKVSKKATQRNLIKRRIHAIMQPIVKSSGKDYFIIVKPEILKITYQELKTTLKGIIKHNG